MGTSSSLEARYQDKILFRYSSYDGFQSQVVPSLCATVVAAGLEATRAAFASQVLATPDPNGDDDPEFNFSFWGAARDRYTQACMDNNQEAFGVDHLMFSGEAYQHLHPYSGALFAFAPEIFDHAEMSSEEGANDFVLDLDAGRVGARLDSGFYLWVSLEKCAGFAPDVVYERVAPWFNNAANSDEMEKMWGVHAVKNKDAHLKKLQDSLDVWLDGINEIAPKDAKDDTPVNRSTKMNLERALALSASNDATPTHSPDLLLPLGDVLALRASAEGNFGLFVALAALRAFSDAAPALDTPICFMESVRHDQKENVLSFEDMSIDPLIRNAQADVIKTLCERLTRSGVFGLLFEHITPTGRSGTNGRGSFAGFGGFGDEEEEIVTPGSRKMLSSHGEFVEKMKSFNKNEQIIHAMCALMVLDHRIWAVCLDDTRASALADPVVKQLLPTTLAAVQAALPGYVAHQFNGFDEATQKVLRDMAGPAAASVFFPKPSSRPPTP